MTRPPCSPWRIARRDGGLASLPARRISCGCGASRPSRIAAWTYSRSRGRTPHRGCWRTAAREARPRCDAHTVTSLVKTSRAIHPRRDGVGRGGAWPAAREPDTRIGTARHAAMDRATGRADRRSRLLSTPRSPPGPAPESVLAARLWPRERRRSHRRSGAAALPRSPRGGGPHAAPRPVPLSACNSGVTRHGIGLMVCAGGRRLPAGQASPAHIPTPHV